MRIWTLLMVTIATGLLAGCVTSTKDGGKPLKQEDPTEQAGKYNVQLGTAYLQQGNYPLAKEKLERALKQNPKDANVHTSLGLLYDRVGEQKLADKHFAWRPTIRTSPTITPSTCARTAAPMNAWSASRWWRATSTTARRKWR